MIGGVPTQPFSMVTLPPLGNPNEKLAGALKQLSAAKYGKPRAMVDKDILARMTTKEPAAAPTFPPASVPGGGFGASRPSWSPPAATQSQPGSTAAMPGSQAPYNPTSNSGSSTPDGAGSSFLDEWLNKRRQPPTTPQPIAPPKMGNHSSALTSAAQPVPPEDVPVFAQGGAKQTGGELDKQEPDQTHDASESGTKNISSDVMEQTEVDKIAEELKSQLKPNDKPDGAEHSAFSVKDTVQPVETPQKAQNATQHSEPEAKEDTIYIDSDGTLHVRQDD